MVEDMAERSVQGLGNAQNEDQTLCMAFESYPAQGRYQLIALAAVADGISSGGGGHIASNMVVKELEMRFTQKNNRVFGGRPDIDAYFENTCREINNLLLNGRHKNQRYRGSTTLVLAGIFRDTGRNQNELLVINAGDSPLYTLDTERGEMKSLAETHIDEMGAVTRCFGSHDFKMYREWHPCPKNGFIFLCSDGVTGKGSKRWVGDEEIERCLLETKTPDEAAGKLIMLAQQRGSKDDISVVILEMGKPGRASTARMPVPMRVMIPAVFILVGCIAAVMAIKALVDWGKKPLIPINSSDIKNVSQTGTKGLTSTGEDTEPIKEISEIKGAEPSPNKQISTEGDDLKELMKTHLKKFKELFIICIDKPDFYDDVFLKQPQYKRCLESSSEVKRLVSETKNYRNKKTKELTKVQQDKIVELNRCTLEVIFPE